MKSKGLYIAAIVSNFIFNSFLNQQDRMGTRTLAIILLTFLILHLGACQTNTTNSTNSTNMTMTNSTNSTINMTSNWTYTTNGSMSNWTNLTNSSSLNLTNSTNGTYWNYSTNVTTNMTNQTMTNMTNQTWNSTAMNYASNMTNSTTNQTWNNYTMNMTNNMTNGTWGNYTQNTTNGTWGNYTMNTTNGTWSNYTQNTTNGTWGNYTQNTTMNMTNQTWTNYTMNMTNQTWSNYTQNMTNGTWTNYTMNTTNNMTNQTWANYTTSNMTNQTWTNYTQNTTMNMTNQTWSNYTQNMTNQTWSNYTQNMTNNMTNQTWMNYTQNTTMNMTNQTWSNYTQNMTNGTWSNYTQNMTNNMTNQTWTNYTQNMTTNMTNQTWSNYTMNTTNQTWMNYTSNMTNQTWTNYTQNMTMNMTNQTWSNYTQNMTNGTWSNYTQNMTMNMTNQTWNNYTMNMTNSTMNMTNQTWTNYTMNMTNNMTNGTWTNYTQNMTMNMTNQTWSNYTQNMTNMTMNYTQNMTMNYTQNMTMNMTNQTMNYTMNMTNNMTNQTWTNYTMNNTMNMTNQTWSNYTMNMTNQTWSNYTQNMTMNMTNGTWTNYTMNMTNNMTNQTMNYTQNMTMNMTNQTMNYTMNMTNNMTGNLTNQTWTNFTQNMTNNMTMNYTMNMTNNITNQTWTNYTQNMTNNMTMNYTQNMTMNMTNQTMNYTQNMTMNMTNQTMNFTQNMTNNMTVNYTQNMTMNMTNQTMNYTQNMTMNQTMNYTQNMTMNMTNQTMNYTQNMTMNMTQNMTNNMTMNQTMNYTQNMTMNMTNQTMNYTQNMTMNMTNQTMNYTQNMTMNMTNQTMNYTQNMTNNMTMNQTMNYTQNMTMNQTMNYTQNMTMNMTNQTMNYTQNMTMNMTNQTMNFTQNMTNNMTNYTMNMTNITANQTWQNVSNISNMTAPTNLTNTTNFTFPTPPPPTFNQTTNFTVNQTQALAYSGITVNSNLSLATAPPITSAGLATLYYSTNEAAFLGSKKPECLRILQDSSNTLIQLDVFNRSETAYISSYTIQSSGLWNFVTSNQDRLTCSLLHNPSTNDYSFLQFNEFQGTFVTLATINQASFPASLSSLTSTQMAGVLLGQNCDAMRYNNEVFSVSSQAVSATSGLSSPIQASSSDLQYVVSGNILFSRSGSSFTSIATLNTHTNYWIKSKFNQIVVWGASAVQNGTNSTYTVSQTVYFIAGSSIIQQIAITAYENFQNRVPVFVSPEFTKVHFEYRASATNNSVTISLYDVHFSTPAVYQVTMVNPLSYLEVIQNVNTFSMTNYFLGDFYLVLRNTTVESTYQFIGQELIPLRFRDLAASEQSSVIYMTYIDQYFLNQLFVLDLYFNSDSTYPGYDIYEYSFGNLAQTIRVIPPAPTIYFNVTLPSSSSLVASNFLLEWTMIVGTDMVRYRENDNATNHVQIDTFPLAGSWAVKAVSTNSQCTLIHNTGTNQFRVIQTTSNGTASTIASTNIISTLLASQVGSSVWEVSNDCLRVRTDTNVYAASSTSSAFALVSAVSSWIAADSDLTYVLTASSILKYTSSNSSYTTVYTFTNSTFSASSLIHSYGGQIIIAELLASAVNAYGFSDSNGVLTQLLAHSSSGYDAMPTVKISPQATKILIYGLVSAAATTHFFYIDYPTATLRQITFPAYTIFDPANIRLELQQNWLYVRQLASGLQTAGNNIEFIFALLLNTIPQVADFRNITASDQASYSSTRLRVLPNGTLFILNKITSSGNVETASLWAAFPGQTEAFDANSNIGVTQYVIQGEVTLCSPGCSDCSTGVCTACSSGYSFDVDAAVCYLCGFGCTFCSSSNPNSCTACYDGFYLSGTSCLPCDATCVTCSGTATNCQNCLPGNYFDGSACASCPRNCKNCTSSGVCTGCRKGFAVTPNGTCRGCSRSCSSCAPSDIMTCTSCAKYLQLNNGACIPCPSRCQKCSSGICAKCDKGYQVSTDQTICVLACTLPCRTCLDNQPSVCTGCYRGFVQNGTTCSKDMACNLDNSCTDCGQGSGYVLVGANCKKCPVIANCIQCSQTNMAACSICNPGYWVQTTSCSLCPATCLTCLTNISCTSCVSGYTIPNDASQGSCVACISPCLTCHGSETYCTSCVTGYTKTNWKCQSNINVGFSFTLTNANTTAQVLIYVDELVVWLLTSMGVNTTFVDLITFTSIRLGSVVVSGTGTTPTGSGSSTTASSSSLASTLSSGTTVGAFTVGSSSVVTNGVQTQSSSSNTAMYVGLGVGIPIVIIIIIIIICVCYRKKNKQVDQSQDKESASNVVFGNVNNIPAIVQQKQGAMMELELPDVSSSEGQGKKTEKDEDFSEFVQAPVRQPEPDAENGSPSPIVIKQPNYYSGNQGIKNYQSEPNQKPVKFKAGQDVVRVHPVATGVGKMNIRDNEDLGQFVESPRKGKEKQKHAKTQQVDDDDQFGEYHQVNPIVAPVAEMDLPDDQFGQIISATPAKPPLTSFMLPQPVEESQYSLTSNDLYKAKKEEQKPKKVEPIVTSPLKPALFEIEIDQSEESDKPKEEKQEEQFY